MIGPAIRRVLSALLALNLVVVLGGATIWFLGGGTWSFFEAIYFAVYTVSTAGFGELPDVERFPLVRVATGF